MSGFDEAQNEFVLGYAEARHGVFCTENNLTAAFLWIHHPMNTWHEAKRRATLRRNGVWTSLTPSWFFQDQWRRCPTRAGITASRVSSQRAGSGDVSSSWSGPRATVDGILFQ